MQERSSRLSKSLIVMLAATSALGPASMQILLPALPVIKSTFEVSTEVAQLTLSLSMLAIALGTLTYGPLSDKFGRRPIMLIGLVVMLIGSVFCYFANTIELLIAARFVQAFGAAVGLVLARAIVRDVYGAEEAARVIATLVMVMVVLPMISPALGGELMARFGWESVFIAMALFGFLIFLVLVIRLPETLEEPVPFEGIGSMLGTFALLFKSKAFSGYAFCVSFVSVVFFSFISAAPEIMISVLKRPPTEYGYYFIMIPLGFMTGNYVARHYGKVFDIDRMISIGATIGVGGICLAIILQLLGFHQPLALFAPVSLAVFGNGITLPNAQAAAINEFPRYAGSASGLTGFLQMFFSAIAAQSVAIIFNGTVYPLLLLMLTASVLSLVSFRLGVIKKS
ncbi:MAG: multidrug effflux MFS transporter [Gammaproteobacteria bacterium]|jgi:DHA1 family bicyclomycin/chloramphenicol resistance-like MFS transporter|nr:multidrug effflux MFS transporter [Gammaproteobacteria bacterium]MBT3859881.1 multidrug effflux MFS transporter [Gammaproteobacteria bacterium]MBT4256079.1 multidrug effflux MFS transporter [Gammaproteobacteria bacterium]MBT4582903.1 multidrug effflux MFS transporter [Gammaproteobacteria bacterium]MBT4658338.1 multidrug effflux MFS transporter [Gammaproteobacteria bacterium]